MPREVRYCRPKTQPAETLLAYLSHKFTYLSHDAWQHHLSEGHVLVNGAIHTVGDAVLQQGDMIRFAPPRSLEPSVDEDNIRVLYEDASLLVCAKNGNLPVAEGGRYCENTLVGVLTRRGTKTFYTADTVVCERPTTFETSLHGSSGEEATSTEALHEVRKDVNVNAPTKREVHGVPALPVKRPRQQSPPPPRLKAMGSLLLPPSLFTVQRLDKETSGALVLCKTPAAAAKVASQLERQTSRCSAAVEAHLASSPSAIFTEEDFDKILQVGGKSVRKTYTAVLRGAAPCGDTFVVVNRMGTMQSHPVLAHDPEHNQLKKLKMCCAPLPDSCTDLVSAAPDSISLPQWGKVACTRVRVLASSSALGLSCVQVELLTGRSHQIRVHCATLGYPVLGDKLYTTATPGKALGCVAVADAVYLARVRDETNRFLEVETGGSNCRRVGCSRHLLHATELSFEHPDVCPSKIEMFVASPIDFFTRDVRFDLPQDAQSYDALLQEAFGKYKQK